GLARKVLRLGGLAEVPAGGRLQQGLLLRFEPFLRSVPPEEQHSVADLETEFVIGFAGYGFENVVTRFVADEIGGNRDPRMIGVIVINKVDSRFAVRLDPFLHISHNRRKLVFRGWGSEGDS